MLRINATMVISKRVCGQTGAETGPWTGPVGGCAVCRTVCLFLGCLWGCLSAIVFYTRTVLPTRFPVFSESCREHHRGPPAQTQQDALVPPQKGLAVRKFFGGLTSRIALTPALPRSATAPLPDLRSTTLFESFWRKHRYFAGPPVAVAPPLGARNRLQFDRLPSDWEDPQPPPPACTAASPAVNAAASAPPLAVPQPSTRGTLTPGPAGVAWGAHYALWDK